MSAAYAFESRWLVAATAERCGEELERMLRPQAASWWPGVTILDVPEHLEPGGVIGLSVRSPLGYRLRVDLLVTGYERGRAITAESTGDLVGTGSIEITAVAEDAASIVFHWNVSTARRWMTVSSPVLRPVFAAAHARVMRAGEKGLAARVRTSA